MREAVLLFAFCLFLLKDGLGQTGPRSSESRLPDTMVNGVLKLLDAPSIRRSIGDQSKRIVEGEGPARVQLVSKDGKEYLILYQLPGSSYNSFNEFEVGLMRSGTRSFHPSLFSSFFTESGIRLGMSLDSLVAVKGVHFAKTVKKGQTVLTYKLEEHDKGSAILRRYNMPEYEATYYFVNSRLIRFVFGFPNP